MVSSERSEAGEERTIWSDLDSTIVRSDDRNRTVFSGSCGVRLSVADIRERSRVLTNLVNARSSFPIRIDDHHFGSDERAILDLEGRAKGDDLYVIDELDIAEQSMSDFLQFRSESVNMLSFSVDGDVLQSLPRHSFEQEREGVVTCRQNILQSENSVEIRQRKGKTNLSHRSPVVESPGNLSTVLESLGRSLNRVLRRLAPNRNRVSGSIFDQERRVDTTSARERLVVRSAKESRGREGEFDEGCGDIELESFFGRQSDGE